MFTELHAKLESQRNINTNGVFSFGRQQKYIL